MLILTRRVSETVMIGNDVTVTVLGIKGRQVRVGIAAPKDVPVHREEIYRRILREREEMERSIDEPVAKRTQGGRDDPVQTGSRIRGGSPVERPPLSK